MMPMFALVVFTVFVSSVSSSETGEKLQNEIITRIEALELQGNNKNRILEAQSITIKQMESKLDAQAAKLYTQEKMILNYRKTVTKLERQVQQLIAENGGRKEESVTKLRQLQSKKEATAPKIASDAQKESIRKQRILTGSDRPVAFHAVIKKVEEVSDIGAGQHIVFPDVMINLGGGYHELQGLFIAPRPGLYVFSTTIMSWYIGHTDIHVTLVKNGNPLGRAYAHGNTGRPDQGSISVVTQLVAGDEVWVSLYGPADTSLFGDYNDSFMGCLIIPM